MKEKRRAFVVVNPTAGGGGCHRTWPEILRLLKKKLGGVEFEETTSIGHARLIASDAVANGYSLIIACGGDGTIHEVVNGILDGEGELKGIPNQLAQRPALGIISVGTGGDFRKTLKLPDSLEEQIQILASSHSRQVDLGEIEYINRDNKKEKRHFINVTDAGLGAEVVKRLSRERKLFGKQLAYFMATIKSYAAWTPKKITVKCDGGDKTVWPEKALCVAIANGRFFGGGMAIAPDADPSDGLFDIVAIGEMKPWKLPSFIARFYGKKIGKMENVKITRAHTVHLSSEEHVGLDIDGEPVGSLPATFRILPKALEVKVP